MTKIKFCGLTRKEDIALVNQLLPDYIGFVFAPSTRQIKPETAAALKKDLHHKIKAIGVFVNEDPETMIMMCKQNIIDILQLHGDEDLSLIKHLKDTLPHPIIKAVRVNHTAKISQAAQLPCDYLLLDAYLPNQYGGSGKTFDWSLIPPIPLPFFLAGGLNAQNIRSAIQRYQPYCIDVSSGVETNGRKDAHKMQEVIKIVRSDFS